MASTCSLTLSQVPPHFLYFLAVFPSLPPSLPSLPHPLPSTITTSCTSLLPPSKHTTSLSALFCAPPNNFSWLNCSLLSCCQDPIQFRCQDFYLFTPPSSLLSIHQSTSQCRFYARCESLHLHQEDSNQMVSDGTWW